MPRLLVAISAHGLGHLGQAAPVCNALRVLQPNLTLIIWSALPINALKARINGQFEHIAHPCDLGLVMHDAMRVDVTSSWARYADREANWSMHLSTACKLVSAATPDIILSDVGDMPLAAGQALSLPNIAMSSLNWADTARFYFESLPGSAAVLGRLTHIYDQTTLALRLSPGMPMRGRREQILPPVGAISRYTRQALEKTINHLIDPALRKRPCFLVGMGGIETQLPFNQWPEQTDVTLLVANQPSLPAKGLAGKGIVNADTLTNQTDLVFSDLLAYCDAIICKPGYGTFVEAALANIPVLYVEREDWPEQQVLVSWLKTHARCERLEHDALVRGNFKEAIAAVLKQPVKAAIRQDGAMVAATEVLRWID